MPVPNDYHFREALLITGPNFGGKTVSLKTIGILVFMALNGFPIPAKEAQIPLFRKILVDLGDEQNLLEGESFFSAHLKNLKRIVEEADSESLILLDEPGRGTNFEEGSAYALEDKRFSIAMVKNYKLIYGYLGESHALELAQKFGFNKVLLDRAKSFLKEKGVYDYYEKYKNEVQKLETLRIDLERKLKKLEKEKRALVEYKDNLQREYGKKWESLLKSWHFEFKKLLESLKNSSEGKAKRAFEKFLEEKRIPFGGEELRVEKGEMASESRDLSMREKVVLLGEDVENALLLLERKLNECFLQRKKTLLVVHGHGTGKLRAAIRRYLEDHPLVERFEEPPIYEGGSGATLVYLFDKN